MPATLSGKAKDATAPPEASFKSQGECCCCPAAAQPSPPPAQETEGQWWGWGRMEGQVVGSCSCVSFCGTSCGGTTWIAKRGGSAACGGAPLAENLIWLCTSFFTFMFIICKLSKHSFCSSADASRKEILEDFRISSTVATNFSAMPVGVRRKVLKLGSNALLARGSWLRDFNKPSFHSIKFCSRLGVIPNHSDSHFTAGFTSSRRRSRRDWMGGLGGRSVAWLHLRFAYTSNVSNFTGLFNWLVWHASFIPNSMGWFHVRFPWPFFSLIWHCWGDYEQATSQLTWSRTWSSVLRLGSKSYMALWQCK